MPQAWKNCMKQSDIVLRHIGKSADDLRFFIIMDGQHAGGISVYGAHPPQFSYGVAVSRHMRRRGAAKGALALLFARMKAAGYTHAAVQIEDVNTASLALHAALGFKKTGVDGRIVRMEKDI